MSLALWRARRPFRSANNIITPIRTIAAMTIPAIAPGESELELTPPPRSVSGFSFGFGSGTGAGGGELGGGCKASSMSKFCSSHPSAIAVNRAVSNAETSAATFGSFSMFNVMVLLNKMHGAPLGGSPGVLGGQASTRR